jgi:hypothetical protein
MHKHPYFDLYLHDDQELASHVGGEILARETLHEWPLSCVQRLVTPIGRWIYKAQFGPTVEAAFYANARSDLLLPTQTLYCADGYTCTLQTCVDAPLIEDLDLTESQAVDAARRARAQMDEIEGDLPYRFDIRTPERWLVLVEGILQDIVGLIEQAKYTQTTPEMVEDLRQWAHSPAALQAVQRKPGHVHGDFTGDNLFVLDDGSYRIIDWQRPFLGPTEVDIASMVESLEHDPIPVVGVGILQIRYFLLIRWFTTAALRWFPDGVPTYDRLTAEYTAKIRSLSK